MSVPTEARLVEVGNNSEEVAVTMLFSVTMILIIGTVGVLVFMTATRSGVFQRKIKQNGLAVYSQGVKRMVDAGELVVVEEKEGEEAEKGEEAEQGGGKAAPAAE